MVMLDDETIREARERGAETAGAPVEDAPQTETEQVPPEVGDGGPGEGGSVPAVCGFVIYQTLDGSWIIDFEGKANLAVQRTAGLYDAIAGCSCVINDVNSAQTADRVMQMQLATAQRLAEQQQAARLQQGLGDLRGGSGGPSRAQRRHGG